MTRANPLLTRRAVVQAAVEASYGDPAALGVNDGVLVSEPEYEIDPNLLERDFVRDDLSPTPIIIGRKLARMMFNTELRGNGRAQLAEALQAPIITRLLRACGYALTELKGPDIWGVFQVGDHINEVEWEASSGARATGTFTLTDNPSDGETVTIGAITYRFVDTLDAAYDVLIGGDDEATAANLRNAINGGTGGGVNHHADTVAHPYVTASGTGAAVVVTAVSPGVWGNALATTDTAVDGSWGGGTLTTGADMGDTDEVVAYYLEVTTGGASGVAEITVTSDTVDQGNAAAAVTSGSPFTLGDKGLELTPTFSGSLVAGQRWIVWLLPQGLRMAPVSDGFESVTLGMNKDGVYHSMPGSFGTFSIEAEAGNYARISWEFTGIYVAPVDAPMASPNYEKTLPAQVELARLRLDDFNAIVANFTYDQANEIVVRPDVSSVEGYIGTRIVSRTPEGGIDPEAELVADYDFWDRMGRATRMPFQMRIGKEEGNIVWFLAPNAQYSNMTYQDRDGILTYDAGLRFSGYNGNDEVCFVFH